MIKLEATALTMTEIMDTIERDLPGWDYLFRSNFRGDGTSDETYFANVMTPDFQGAVICVPGGFIDASFGNRFTAYGATKEQALAMAYNNAMDHFHASEPA